MNGKQGRQTGVGWLQFNFGQKHLGVCVCRTEVTNSIRRATAPDFGTGERMRARQSAKESLIEWIQIITCSLVGEGVGEFGTGSRLRVCSKGFHRCGSYLVCLLCGRTLGVD